MVIKVYISLMCIFVMVTMCIAQEAKVHVKEINRLFDDTGFTVTMAIKLPTNTYTETTSFTINRRAVNARTFDAVLRTQIIAYVLDRYNVVVVSDEIIISGGS